MDEFDRYRADMNEKLLGSNHLGIKRFFALDTQALFFTLVVSLATGLIF